MYKRSVEDPEGFWSDIAKEFYWKKQVGPFKMVSCAQQSDASRLHLCAASTHEFRTSTMPCCSHCAPTNVWILTCPAAPLCSYKCLDTNIHSSKHLTTYSLCHCHQPLLAFVHTQQRMRNQHVTRLSVHIAVAREAHQLQL